MSKVDDSHFAVPKSYLPAKNFLVGRSILVTGASGDLGCAAARAFASHGATVVLLDHDVSALETVYDDIVQAGGPEPAIYPMT